MNKLSKLIAVVTVVAAAAALRCSAPVPVEVADGGASGTDVGICKVYGEVNDSLGRPVAGCVVRLRPFDYLAGSADTTIVKKDTLTGTDGRFTLDHVPTGHYSIECTNGDSSGKVITCVVDTVDSATFLPLAVIQPLAVVFGTIPDSLLADGGYQSVRVIGLERSALIDSTGNFRLLVPTGWNRINLHHIDPDRTDYDTLVYLQPGGNELMKQPRRNPPICDSLDCQLAIVRSILDTNDRSDVMPESVVVITNGRITELRLRRMGLRVLPDQVGMLFSLRVIDVGENWLHELPRSIEFLHRLNELYADRNLLWMVVPSIGTLDSLGVLDFSNNRLQSLPETIVFLTLGKVNFGNNMLCNIGEATRKWLDNRDPDWKDTQDCRGTINPSGGQ